MESEPGREKFSYDRVCMVVNLRVKPQHNGRAVRVCVPSGKIADDRVPCQFLIGYNHVAIKPQNLRLIATEDALEDEDVVALMSEEDRMDAGMLMHTQRDSTVIAPGISLMRCNTTNDSRSSSPVSRRNR